MQRRSAIVWLWLAGLAGWPAGVARAQTSYPMITSVYPAGLQRGTTAEITVFGRFNLAGAYGVQFEKPGLTAEVVPPPAGEEGKPRDTLTLRVMAASDAPLGPQEFRVATPRGLSSLGVIVVGAEPEAQEKEGNDRPEQANAIDLPVTLNGRIQAAEDVDCFRFTARAGETIVFAVLSARLQDKIHDLTPGSGGTHSDPVLVLTDDSGRELAVGDDYWGPDPLLVHRFEAAGSYVLQVRDVRYLGNAGWTYRVTCTRDPYLLALYPMAGQRGGSVSVQPVGFNLGSTGPITLSVPAAEPGAVDLQIEAGGKRTNPVPFLVSDLPQALESESNDAPDRATPVTLPAGLNGRIEKEGDVDAFRFRASKGQAFTFEVLARRYGSSLDSVLQILDAAGKPLANNDDAVGKDSRLDWTAPADGDYILQIADLHSRGGEAFVYHIVATPARPDFELRCDDDKALIGPGSGYAMYVTAIPRNGFASDIRLSVEGLPPGVTATADRIPARMLGPQSHACVIFRAAPDARPAFSRIRIVGTAEITLPDGRKETIRREAIPWQEIYSPGGGRARYPVNLHAASVTEPSDVVVKVSATEVTLKPGGTAEIGVEVTRQKGYDKNVVLDVYLQHLNTKYGNPLPPGVTVDVGRSKTLLGPKETQGKIVLRAAPDAPEIERLPIAVLGQVSINFVVKISQASEPIWLSVKK